MSNLQDLKMDWEQATFGGQVASLGKFLVFGFCGINHAWSYLFWFRMSKSKSCLISFPSKVIHKMLGKIMKINIPASTNIGGGLYLGEAMCMVVNPGTEIGQNSIVS